ncbi:MAG: peptidoglycan-binding domain-containing protein, partial [Patescibacteria group bacterium]
YYTLRSVDTAGNESKSTKPIKINAGQTTKPPIPTGLSVGKSSTAVKNLQKTLISSGLLASDFKLSNLFDEQTNVALQSFQERHGLPMTGKVDKKTAILLNRLFLLNKTL